MDRTVALLNSDASDVWLSPAVGAVAGSGPPAGESQSGVSGAKTEAVVGRLSAVVYPEAAGIGLGESSQSE